MRSFCKILILSVFYAVLFAGCSEDDEKEKEKDTVIKWTTVSDSKFGTDGINTIIYGDGKFVAGGANGKMAYSYDGKIWTAVEDSKYGGYSISGIAYGNGKYVAVGYKSYSLFGYVTLYNNRIASSYDGISWTMVAGNDSSSSGIRGVIYADGKFVASGDNGTMFYSTNGEMPWTGIDSKIASGYDISRVTYGKGKFVALGSRYYYVVDFGGYTSYNMSHSIDGINWNKVNFESPLKTVYSNIAYGAEKFVLNSGDVIGTGSLSYYDANMYYSDDGSTFQPIPSKLNAVFDCISYGGDKFVAVARGGVATAYSYDGIEWNYEKNSKLGEYIYDIAYGDGKFVAVGAKGKIAYSNKH
jgi:hypothetical protein